MLRFLVTVIVGCVLFSSSGCARPEPKLDAPSMKETIKKTMNSWMGSHISDVIHQWGPYNQVTEDGRGGRIYIWQLQQQIPMPQTSSVRPPPPVSGSGKSVPGVITDILRYKIANERATTYTTINITHSWMFYVRPNGIVYHWRTDTN